MRDSSNNMLTLHKYYLSSRYMLSKQTIISLILLPFALASSWIIWHWLSLPNVEIAKYRPDSFVTHIVAVQMDETGKPKNVLTAPKMVHYPAGDTTDTLSPHFIIYSDSGQPWHITADKGRAQQGTEIITLWDNVKMYQPPGLNNPAITITTSTITVYPHQQTAHTSAPIMLKQVGGNVHSVGLNADLKTGAIDLLSQVRGQYQEQKK